MESNRINVKAAEYSKKIVTHQELDSCDVNSADQSKQTTENFFTDTASSQFKQPITHIDSRNRASSTATF